MGSVESLKKIWGLGSESIVKAKGGGFSPPFFRALNALALTLKRFFILTLPFLFHAAFLNRYLPHPIG